MSDTTTGFCDVVGCTGSATTSRWVTFEDHGKLKIEVCWKHAEGDIDPDELEPSGLQQ